jgi:hypothetical protein
LKSWNETHIVRWSVDRWASREVVIIVTLFGRLEAGIGAAVIFFRRGGGDLATTTFSWGRPLGVGEEPKGQVAAASFFGTSSSLRKNIEYYHEGK